MTTKIKIIIILLSICFNAHSLSVDRVRDISELVTYHQHILRIEVIDSSIREFEHANSRITCGIVYKARILEKIKNGLLPEIISFSSLSSFKTGKEYLVFFSDEKLLIPVEENRKKFINPPPYVDSQEFHNCINSLPELNTGNVSAYKFEFKKSVVDNYMNNWLIYDDINISLPKEIELTPEVFSLCKDSPSSDCEIIQKSMLIDWAMLKENIIKEEEAIRESGAKVQVSH